MLATHLKLWKIVSNSLSINKQSLEIIIVDDHSSVGEEPNVELLKQIDLPITVVKIENDIIWNISGAKNLGASMARYSRLIMADFDFAITPELIVELNRVDLSDPNLMLFPLGQYNRNQKYGPFGKVNRGHCNSFVISKELFNRVGGYDEDFAGAWGSEDSYFLHLCDVNGARKVEMTSPGFFFHIRDRSLKDITYYRYNMVRNQDLFKRKKNKAAIRNYGPTLRFKHRVIHTQGY